MNEAHANHIAEYVATCARRAPANGPDTAVPVRSQPVEEHEHRPASHDNSRRFERRSFSLRDLKLEPAEDELRR